MADRMVTVTLKADISAYQRALATAAAETKAFGRATDGLGGSGGPLARTEQQSGRTSSEIDKLSGRLRVLTDAALVLGPALVPLGAGAIGGMVALSAQLGATATAFGVTLLATKGLGDGLKALDAYQLNPTAENLAKVNQQMEKLGPSGAHFVQFLDSLEPDLKSLQMMARDGLLPGAEDGIQHLMTLLPEVKALVADVSTELGKLASEAGAGLAGPKFEAFFNYLHNTAAPMLDDMGHTLGNLAEAAANVFVGFGGVSSGFSKGLLSFSEDLAKASENLDTNQGFQDFLSYIQTEGPHALDTLGSLANAVLQIVEATAPLGGPVLTAIKGFADAIAKIADSDLGTPIFAALAGLALYNRSLALTAGLNKTAWGGAALGSMRAFRTELTTVTTAQDRARMSAMELDAANTASSKAWAGGLATIGKSAALLGALTIASSDYGQATGVSNTISLGLAGTMAGPYGFAIGTAAGFVMDLKHANDDLAASMSAIDTAKATGNLDAYSASVTSAADAFNKANEQASFSSLFTLGGVANAGKSTILQQYDSLTGKTKDYADAIEAASKDVAGLADGSKVAFNPVSSLATAINDAVGAAQAEAQALKDATDAMEKHRQEAIRSVDAHLNYRAAILDANDALKKNGKTVDENTRAGEDNLSKLHALAGAWNEQSNAAKNAKGSLEDARHNFIDTAEAMGMAEGKAHLLANRLFEIPPKRKTQIELDGADDAIAKVKTLADYIRNLHGKSIDIALNYQRHDIKPAAPTPGVPNADGGTVPKTGLGYADRHPYMLADGEEVVSNRFGQADRHRALLKAINANRMANGGTAGRGNGDGPLFPGEGPRYYKAAYKHNKPFALDGPAKWDWPYQTGLTEALVPLFEAWVKDNKIPFDSSARIVDYDMRGFWRKKRPTTWHAGDHFPDTYKTPYDTRFSAESKYATADCPFHWHGDKLIDDRNGQVIAASNGATVAKTGLPYADRHPYLLADGEEVISNRHGQADRHRSLLKAINAGRMADGGTAGGGVYTSMLGDGRGGNDSAAGGIHIFTSGVYSVAKALKALQVELDAASKVVDKDKAAREAAIAVEQAFASSVGGAYSKADPFAGGLDNFDTALQANTNDTAAAQAALSTAAGNGLDGPLYQALAASGNLMLLQQFAGLSAADITTREQQFATQSTAQGNLGSSAADSAGFTQAIKDQTKELQQARQERRDLTAAVKDMQAKLPDKVEAGARAGVADRQQRTHVRTRTG